MKESDKRAFKIALSCVSTEYEKLVSKSRRSDISEDRQIVMYLLRKYTRLHLVAIGELFNRDHSTVLHSLRVLPAKAQYDKALTQKIDYVESMFNYQLGIDKLNEQEKNKKIKEAISLLKENKYKVIKA